jgi:glyoxylase-like metal-dependent hydrolase (beta-lactamase superfamily II)
LFGAWAVVNFYSDPDLHDGETVRIKHYGRGHTDGDMSVYFAKADVLQTGDTVWNGVYPFIDYVTGGSIDGAIRAANANIAMATNHTRVIPGHGPSGSRADLVAFRDMLLAIRNKVAALKSQGRSLSEVIVAKPTAAYDAKWGGSVISGALFTALVYRGV